MGAAHPATMVGSAEGSDRRETNGPAGGWA